MDIDTALQGAHEDNISTASRRHPDDDDDAFPEEPSVATRVSTIRVFTQVVQLKPNAGFTWQRSGESA
jgi:hypothetical protein